jgi:hypothetical protein
MLQPLYPWERDPVPIVQEAGWASGLVWNGYGNPTSRGFEPLIIQPLASCYTDYAITAAILCVIPSKIVVYNVVYYNMYM